MESTGNEGVKGGSGWVVWRRLCERVVAEWGGVGVFQGGAGQRGAERSGGLWGWNDSEGGRGGARGREGGMNQHGARRAQGARGPIWDRCLAVPATGAYMYVVVLEIRPWKPRTVGGTIKHSEWIFVTPHPSGAAGSWAWPLESGRRPGSLE